jgi:FtsZ-binding cell division protein ZapB
VTETSGQYGLEPHGNAAPASWPSRHPWWTATIAAVLALALGLLGGYALFDDSSEVDDLEAENAELKQQASEAGSEVGRRAEELEAENDRLKSENQALEDQITSGLAALESTVSTVGDYSGRDASEVSSEAQAAGWAVTHFPLLDTGQPAGTVILQAPATGTPMVAGSSLVLYVAAELSDVGVDQAGDYVGQPVNDVATEAAQYGWVVTIRTRQDDSQEIGTILEQSPDSGTAMTQGSSLVLTVAIPTITTTSTTAPAATTTTGG